MLNVSTVVLGYVTQLLQLLLVKLVLGKLKPLNYCVLDHLLVVLLIRG